MLRLRNPKGLFVLFQHKFPFARKQLVKFLIGCVAGTAPDKGGADADRGPRSLPAGGGVCGGNGAPACKS